MCSVIALTLGCIGCGPTSDDTSTFDQPRNFSVPQVFPLAGTVTIDGHEPAAKGSVIVMLTGRKLILKREQDRPFAVCDTHGRFSFDYFRRGDGAPAGNYVVVIAQLRENGRSYAGPDGLRNLYNDPAENATKPEFCIEHQAPGKSGYHFDLKTQGVEGVDPAAPNALTKISAD